MAKSIFFIASNYGLCAEEGQAPWDALRKQGHNPSYHRVVDRQIAIASFHDPFQPIINQDMS